MIKSNRFTRFLGAGLVLVALAGLTACGGGGSDTTTPPTPPPVTTYLSALLCLSGNHVSSTVSQADADSKYPSQCLPPVTTAFAIKADAVNALSVTGLDPQAKLTGVNIATAKTADGLNPAQLKFNADHSVTVTGKLLEGVKYTMCTATLTFDNAGAATVDCSFTTNVIPCTGVNKELVGSTCATVIPMGQKIGSLGVPNIVAVTPTFRTGCYVIGSPCWIDAILAGEIIFAQSGAGNGNIVFSVFKTTSVNGNYPVWANVPINKTTGVTYWHAENSGWSATTQEIHYFKGTTLGLEFNSGTYTTCGELRPADTTLKYWLVDTITCTL